MSPFSLPIPPSEYALLRASAAVDGKQVLHPGYRLAVGSKSIIGQVSAAGKALIVSDVTLDPYYLPDPLLPETRSELAIPLLIGQRVLGALDVQSAQVNAFHADDVSVLQILADQLAVAIANAELFAETQDLLVKHRLLRQVTIAASSSTNLEDALLNVASGLLSAKAAEQITILLLNAQRMLHVSTSAGEKGTHHLEVRITLGQGITGQVAEEKRSIRVDDIQSDPRYIYTETGIRSELAVPILFGEEIIGVLDLESSQVAAFNENDEEIIGALGSSLGGIIANVRLVNQVRQQIQRERQLYEATSKIRRSVDLETILETSTQEICKVIGARRARIHITAGKSLNDRQTGDPQQPGNNGRNTDRDSAGGSAMSFFHHLSPSYLPPAAVQKGGLRIHRERIIQVLLIIFCVLGLPSVVLAVSGALAEGKYALAFVYIPFYLLFVVMLFGRGLPYSLRASLIVSVAYLLAVTELFESGQLGEVRMFLVTFVALAAVLFNYRIVIGSIVLGLLTIISVGILITVSPTPILPSLAHIAEGTNWITSTVVFFMLATMIVGAVSMIISGLEQNLKEQSLVMQKLETERNLTRPARARAHPDHAPPTLPPAHCIRYLPRDQRAFRSRPAPAAGNQHAERQVWPLLCWGIPGRRAPSIRGAKVRHRGSRQANGCRWASPGDWRKLDDRLGNFPPQGAHRLGCRLRSRPFQ